MPPLQQNLPGAISSGSLFESVRTGVQTFTTSATGYASATITVKILRGKNTEVIVKMEKG